MYNQNKVKNKDLTFIKKNLKKNMLKSFLIELTYS